MIPGMEVWQRPLQGGEYALAAVSTRVDGRPQHMHFTLSDAGLKPDVGSYLCVDLFDPNHRAISYKLKETISLYILPDSIIMYRCYPEYFSASNNAENML